MSGMNILSGKTGVLLVDRLRQSDLSGTDVTISSENASDLIDLINEVSLWVQRGQPYVRSSSLADSFSSLTKGGAR